jgi:hypothetical protein
MVLLPLRERATKLFSGSWGCKDCYNRHSSVDSRHLHSCTSPNKVITRNLAVTETPRPLIREVPEFEYRLGYRLSWQAYCGFPQSAQANSGIRHQIMPSPLSSTSFPIHHSLILSFKFITPPFDVTATDSVTKYSINKRINDVIVVRSPGMVKNFPSPRRPDRL